MDKKKKKPEEIVFEIILGGVIAACESVFNMVSGAFNAGRAFMRDLRYEFWW